MDGIDTGSVLQNRGLNGYGFGYGMSNGNFGGDGSAVKEGVRGNRDISLLESVNRASADNFISDRVADGHRNINDNLNMGNQFLTDRINAQGVDSKFQFLSSEHASLERLMFANQASLERTLSANKADTDRQLHAQDIKQTECCCELKAGQARIEAQLTCQNEIATAVAAARNQASLEALIAANGGHHGGNG